MLIVICALIQSVTATAMLGRVMSFLGFVTLGAAPLAYALTGFITEHINLTTAFTLSAFLAGLAGASLPSPTLVFAALALPRLSQLDKYWHPHGQPAEATRSITRLLRRVCWDTVAA